MRFYLPKLPAIPISLDQLFEGVCQPRVFLTKTFGFSQRLVEQLLGRFEVAFFLTRRFQHQKVSANPDPSHQRPI